MSEAPGPTTFDSFTHVFRPGSGEPAHGAPRRRTLVLLHGTGGDENDLLPLGAMIDPSANVLSPRGRVLENGMPRFFERIAEGVFNLDDVRRRADELTHWLDAAAARYDVDRDMFIAVGFSNGANVAAAAMIQRPGAFAGAILIRAMHTIDPPATPSLSLAASSKGEGSEPPASSPSSSSFASSSSAALLLTGDSDPIVSAASANKLAAALTAAGVAVDHRRLPSGHSLTRYDVDAASTWLGTVSGHGRPSPS